MVPIVEYSEASTEEKEQGGKRRRNCLWKEFRLCTVSTPNEEQTHYGVTRGTPFEAGCMMYQTCQQKGMSLDTKIHGVADGAPWIAEQYEAQFGDQHDFLLDFYHASEYLAEASKDLSGDLLLRKSWLKRKQNQLKEGKTLEAIKELKVLSAQASEESPIAVAAQYLSNRKEQLNYQDALAKNLPIGSGEVESGHRSVLQSRLKKPGAWWSIENAQSMAQLKVLQANRMWNSFWDTLPA